MGHTNGHKVFSRITYVCNVYPRTGVCRGIPIFFLIFALKHILWVLVRTSCITWTCYRNGYLFDSCKCMVTSVFENNIRN